MRYKVYWQNYDGESIFEVWAGNMAEAQRIAKIMFGDMVLRVEKI